MGFYFCFGNEIRFIIYFQVPFETNDILTCGQIFSEKTIFLGEFKPCFAKPFFRYKKNDIIQNENRVKQLKTRDTGTESKSRDTNR